MEIAERIGKTAFNFNLIFALVVTVIGIALLANGVNPGEKVTLMFMPLDWVYQRTFELQQTLPEEPTPLDVLQALGVVGVLAVFLEFLFMMISGFLLLIHVIASLLPEQLAYLSVPLYFLGAFVQLMSWVYMVSTIVSKIASTAPFFRK